jgi:hypothetical protein
VDASDRDVVERWSELSRKIVFGSYTDLHGAEFGEFLDDAEHALAEIDDDGIKRLLSPDAWEPRIVGAWIAGVKKRRAFLSTIAGLLLSNRFPFVSHGYCFALARFADDESSDALVRYLDESLPRREIEYDQVWAMAALGHVDATRGTSRRFWPPMGRGSVSWRAGAGGRATISRRRAACSRR